MELSADWRTGKPHKTMRQKEPAGNRSSHYKEKEKDLEIKAEEAKAESAWIKFLGPCSFKGWDDFK